MPSLMLGKVAPTPLVFSDAFNRADGPPGAPWVINTLGSGGAPVISGNQIALSGAASDTQTSMKVQRQVPNFDVSVTITALPTTGVSDDMGIVARGAGNAYGGTVGMPTIFLSVNNTASLTLYYPGSSASIGAPSGYILVGDVLRMTQVGNTVTVYRNGVSVYSNAALPPSSDPNQTWIGLFFERLNTAGRMDNFSLA